MPYYVRAHSPTHRRQCRSSIAWSRDGRGRRNAPGNDAVAADSKGKLPPMTPPRRVRVISGVTFHRSPYQPHEISKPARPFVSVFLCRWKENASSALARSARIIGRFNSMPRCQCSRLQHRSRPNAPCCPIFSSPNGKDRGVISRKASRPQPKTWGECEQWSPVLVSVFASQATARQIGLRAVVVGIHAGGGDLPSDCRSRDDGSRSSTGLDHTIY
jgi:hypothetical protein